MRKIMVIGFLLATQGAMASVCDIMNNGNNYYAVSRDGQQFTNYSPNGDFVSAISARDEAIQAEVCSLPVKLETCDIMNNGNNYYAVSRTDVQFTNYSPNGDYQKAISDLKVLVDNKVCIKRKATTSVCDVVNNGNNYYAVSRDGQQFTNFTSNGDLKSAVKMRNELVSAGLCVLN